MPTSTTPYRSTPENKQHNVPHRHSAFFVTLTFILLLMLTGLLWYHYMNMKVENSVYAPNTGGNAHNNDTHEVSPFYRASIHTDWTDNHKSRRI